MTHTPDKRAGGDTAPAACSMEAWLAWKLLFGEGQHGWQREYTSRGVLYRREISPRNDQPLTRKYLPYSKRLHQAAIEILKDQCGTLPLYDDHKTHRLTFAISEEDYIQLIRRGMGSDSEGLMERRFDYGVGAATPHAATHSDALRLEYTRHALLGESAVWKDLYPSCPEFTDQRKQCQINKAVFGPPEACPSLSDVRPLVEMLLCDPPLAIPRGHLKVSEREGAFVVSVARINFDPIRDAVQAAKKRPAAQPVVYLDHWRNKARARSTSPTERS